MEIEITKKDADYIWTTMGLKDADPLRANDECWWGDDAFYDIRQYDELVIRVVYAVIDSQAGMDTDDFADWNNPTGLYIISDATPDDYA